MRKYEVRSVKELVEEGEIHKDAYDDHFNIEVICEYDYRGFVGIVYDGEKDLELLSILFNNAYLKGVRDGQENPNEFGPEEADEEE